jgi:hypothetical protein
MHPKRKSKIVFSRKIKKITHLRYLRIHTDKTELELKKVFTQARNLKSIDKIHINSDISILSCIPSHIKIRSIQILNVALGDNIKYIPLNVKIISITRFYLVKPEHIRELFERGYKIILHYVDNNTIQYVCGTYIHNLKYPNVNPDLTYINIATFSNSEISETVSEINNFLNLREISICGYDDIEDGIIKITNPLVNLIGLKVKLPDQVMNTREILTMAPNLKHIQLRAFDGLTEEDFICNTKLECIKVNGQLNREFLRKVKAAQQRIRYRYTKLAVN